jgi:hypothetical protein
MGDAGVALPGADRPFFYNPAQLPVLSSYFTVVGVQAAAGHTLRRQVDFLNRDLRPAVESEFDGGGPAMEALYRKARREGRGPGRGHGAVVLPSFAYITSGFGVGGGLFAKTALNYRIDDGGLGVPEVSLLSRTDIVAALSVGADLDVVGLPGLSVGGTLTREQRFLTFENKPIDTLAPDESAVLVEGSVLQVDIGALYVPDGWGLPGQLSLGGAAYDVLDNSYDYTVGSSPPQFPFLDGLATGGPAPDSAEEAQAATQARRLFPLERSYRVGVAYRFAHVLGLNDVGLALDYQDYRRDVQHPLARLHFGVRGEPVDGVVLRGGLSAGYPTGGVGIRVGAFRVDYALHAFEEGRAPGQASTYVHSGRLLLRIQ